MDRICSEKKIIELQLQRKIDNEFVTIDKCIWGFPRVIRSSLIKNSRPFPTIFWLTCPLLHKSVSKMEEKGMIKFFEKKLKNDQKIKERFLKAHKATKEMRKFLLPKETPFWIKKELFSKGIGGTRNFFAVKCLHLQLANFLGGIDNPIGEEVWKSIHVVNCQDNNIICEKLVENDTKRN
ncbi:MAG: DUF501 domain-containing protein [Kosmotoga sp.]|nr:MAG: DUF501 domain-containing protein [Kosmotoga sp.]